MPCPPHGLPSDESGFTTLIRPESVIAFANRVATRRDDWLHSVDRFMQTAEGIAPGEPVLIIADDPVVYVAQCFSALSLGYSAVCGSPSWTPAQRRELSAQWPHLCSPPEKGTGPSQPDSQFLYISTGGTGGQLKFARHTGRSIAAAIGSLRAFLNCDSLSAIIVLRPFHTGGLMPWLRAFVTGGEVLPTTLDALGAGSVEPPGQAVLSLVPTQLHDLLHSGSRNWCRGIGTILIGGAPTSAGLLRDALTHRIPVVPSYGMTETAGLVAAQPTGEICADSLPAARLLPGNHAEIDPDGQIILRSAALFSGYGNEPPHAVESWATGDLGYIDDEGRIVVTGRLRPWINSGGKKIAPERIEAAIARVFPGRQVRALAVPDTRWGEVAAVVMTGPSVGVDCLRDKLRPLLPPEGLPRIVQCVDAMPVDERGKTTLEALRKILA